MLRFGSGARPFILESSQSNDGLGQWSFLGADPFDRISGESRLAEGLACLRKRMSRYQTEASSEIPFIGGAVGFLAYEYGRRIEDTRNPVRKGREVPRFYFSFYDGIAAYHHGTNRLYLVALGIRDPVDTVLDRLKAVVHQEIYPDPAIPVRGEWKWNLTHEVFLASVDRVRAYIASGDVYQVNLSRRACCDYEGDALQLYSALRAGNPAPYSAYLNLGELQIFSTSPEQLLQKRGSRLVTRPVKGTRPRGRNSQEDLRNAEALRNSAKDQAELLMIVDLERNDLGRVSRYGSIEVEQLYHLEHYARVIHQTAQVKGVLARGKDVFDCMEALFPGGSVTGAPKIRAMQIIEELEPTQRGVYCGSIGYIGFDGNAELNVAIRTLHLKNGQLDYQVGAGIVWDSEPEAEYRETLDKGRAIRETIDALCRKS